MIDERTVGPLGIEDGLESTDAAAEADQDDARAVVGIRTCAQATLRDQVVRWLLAFVNNGFGPGGADRQTRRGGAQGSGFLQEAPAIEWCGHGTSPLEIVNVTLLYSLLRHVSAAA